MGLLGLFRFDSNKIIVKNLKTEFQIKKINSFSFTNLEKLMTKNLRNLSENEFNDSIIEAEMIIQLMELQNFDNFVALRLGYYAITISIFSLIFSSTELINELQIDLKYIITGMCAFMSFVIITHKLTSNKQKESLVYYRFKLRCMNKIITERKCK